MLDETLDCFHGVRVRELISDDRCCHDSIEVGMWIAPVIGKEDYMPIVSLFGELLLTVSCSQNVRALILPSMVLYHETKSDQRIRWTVLHYC